MTSVSPTPSFEDLCAQLIRFSAQLTEVDLTAVSPQSLQAGHQAVELSRRTLDAAELRLINVEIEWHVPFDNGFASPSSFVAQLLKISPATARTRVRDAASFGPRRDHYGNDVGAVFALCADAVASGAITCQAARAIVREFDKIPDDILADAGATIEAEMVRFARDVDAAAAARFAQDLRYRLDQDGQLRDDRRHDKARDLIRRRRHDGSGTYVVDATNELSELLDTVLDTYARPKPAVDGAPDPRTPGQRAHDGLRDALRDLLSSEAVPQHAGCRTTVVLHASVNDFARNEGSWTTGHGYAVPMDLGKTWLEPETRCILVMLTKTKGIEAYSSIDRLFTEQQRLAMQARDGGCSFTGCDRPAAWTEAHHVVEYRDSGHTRVDEGALVCGEHHRSFERLGWRSVMLDGRPAWIPPKWVDPAGTAKINLRHHGLD